MTRLGRHRWLAAGLLAVVAIAIWGVAPVLAAATARNVIVLIADGCASEQHTFARWFKGAPLSYDPYQVGAIKTYIADSVIADSAPWSRRRPRKFGTSPWPPSWRGPGS
jgi:alkaline phosphatase